MLQHVVQDTGAEGIARSSGLDHTAQLAGWLEHGQIAIVGMAAVRACCHVQRPDVRILFFQRGGTRIKILITGQKQQFVIRDLQDIALTEPPTDLPPCVVHAAPQRRTRIRVEGNQRAALFRRAHRVSCCF